MNYLHVTLWAESMKVRKSKIFWLSMVFFIFVSVMTGLIVFIQMHPAVSQKLGLIGTKASLMRFGEPCWKNYLALLLQVIDGIGLIGFGFITSWIFGREYSDKTLKDLLALPVDRMSVVFSKIIVVLIWSFLLTSVFLASALIFGYLTHLPGWSGGIFILFLYKCAVITGMIFLLCTIPAFFTCYSGSIMLPAGIIILTMMMANFSGLLGLSPYFPWAVPGLLCEVPVNEAVHLPVVSLVILALTGIAGLTGTVAWWQYADHK